MDIRQVICTKRDGDAHPREELRFLAQAAAGHQEATDYQLSAWLMAAYLNGLNEEETAWLTVEMADSGERLNLSGLPHPWVDKHSTGGVGDKTTLVLLPLLAACGLTMVKMSGRGLGITGGTIDKLESIPGFRTDLTPAEMIAQADEIGLALTGQNAALAPADKTLYALRDATGTVGCVPLIVSSILSKKLAGGAEKLVLDVKCGSGGFMKTRPEAQHLAESLERVAEAAGLSCRTVITDMDQPLGRAVGNALEVEEALDVLEGQSGRFRDLCIHLAGITLAHAGIDSDELSGQTRASSALADGSALAKFDQWLLCQSNGKSGVGNLRQTLPRAAKVTEISWHGPEITVSAVSAFVVGTVALSLGAGRATKGASIDHSVGIEVLTEVGKKLSDGDVAFRVHLGTETATFDPVQLINAIS
ncbi:MAG: thymidine phosphorylase [Fimbriimonadaceae bacterium]